MSLPNLVDSRDRLIPLERELASGGEGTVYTLRGDPGRVAKVYKQPPDTAKVDKLRWMIDHASERLTRVSAWPTDLLREQTTKQAVGFLMPNLAGFEPIHHLYNPAQRLRYFSRSTWAFLVAAARNTAASFDELHQAGVLVGDINQSNLRVSQQALVRLIDCDSFQVTVGGQHHLCEVGVAHYTPPELQGKSFAGLVRTLNHDRFGLAVVIFQLLVVGRHPYAGIYLGAGELSFEEAIAQYRFAYGANAGRLQMRSPPFTPTLADLPPVFADLFARSFESGSENDRRPAALEWCQALDTLASEMTTCKSDPGHQHWKGASDCPWCRIAGQRGPDYFLGVGDPSFVFTPDEPRLKALLRQLAQLEKQAQPDVVSLARTMLPSSKRVKARPLPANIDGIFRWTVPLLGGMTLGLLVSLFGCLTTTALWIGLPLLLGSLGLLVLMILTSTWTREMNQRRHEFHQAAHELQAVQDRAGSLLSRGVNQRAGQLRRLRQVLELCQVLPREYMKEVASLAGRLEELAQLAYLRNFFISDATIPKIGEGRKQILAMYNIHTAADLDPETLKQIKGFGRALINYLMNWRQKCLDDFVFDRNQRIPESEQRAVAIQFRRQEQTYFTEADRLTHEIRAGTSPEDQELADFPRQMEAAHRRWLQAEADWVEFLQRYPALIPRDRM